MTAGVEPLYDDGRIRCDTAGLTIRGYYPWGSKRIEYTSIRGVTRMPLTGWNAVRRWRIWGSGDLLHWWNGDLRRPHKSLALVIDLGHWVRPTITPHEPEVVDHILRERAGLAR